jgi:hypothetical protein
MSFNLFDWIREGVKRSVMQGVAEALETIGSPPGDTGAAQLNQLLATTAPATSLPTDPAKRKRLGRSLRDVDAGG